MTYPANRPHPSRGRWSTVYEITTHTHASTMARHLGHHTPTEVERGYDGRTVQPLRRRERQHRYDKPWADLIHGHARPLWQGWATHPELCRRERNAIRTRGCRYNIEDALDLPRHVPKWVQVRQRWARDDAAGRRRWIPPQERTLLQRLCYHLDAAVAMHPPWAVKTGLWAATWLPLWGMTTALIARTGMPHPAPTAAIATAFALVWSVRHPAPTRNGVLPHHR